MVEEERVSSGPAAQDRRRNAESTNPVRAMLSKCGIDFDKISKQTKDRLVLLNQGGGFLDEIEASMATMEKFFGFLEEAGITLTPEQKKHTLAGELLSDIGKTGDHENIQSPEQRRVIYELYKIKDTNFI